MKDFVDKPERSRQSHQPIRRWGPVEQDKWTGSQCVQRWV